MGGVFGTSNYTTNNKFLDMKTPSKYSKTSNNSGGDNDYLLTGHGKITFNLQQQKIIGKRKNSADRAKDILESQ